MNNYHFKIGDWIRFTGHISHQEHIGRIIKICVERNIVRGWIIKDISPDNKSTVGLARAHCTEDIELLSDGKAMLYILENNER
jgi:hypothetical protein